MSISRVKKLKEALEYKRSNLQDLNIIQPMALAKQ